MKLAVRIALLIGLALLISLIAHEGAAILIPISRAGWVLLWLVPLHVVPVLLDSRGWQVLIHRRVNAGVLFWIATVREAVDRLLPVANIGGELVGVRLLAVMGVDGVAAAASVTTELLLTLCSQYVFVLGGVTCLLSVTDTVHSAGDELLGLGQACRSSCCWRPCCVTARCSSAWRRWPCARSAARLCASWRENGRRSTRPSAS